MVESSESFVAEKVTSKPKLRDFVPGGIVLIHRVVAENCETVPARFGLGVQQGLAGVGGAEVLHRDVVGLVDQVVDELEDVSEGGDAVLPDDFVTGHLTIAGDRGLVAFC